MPSTQSRLYLGLTASLLLAGLAISLTVDQGKFGEPRSFLSRRLSFEASEQETLFSELDKDGDGHLTKKEFEKFFPNHQTSHTERWSDFLHSELDKDGSESLDLKEFVTAFQAAPA